MNGVVRVGCSSWTSDAWWGRVYPEKLPDGERLAYYAQRWDTVEIDSTYYRDPGPYLFRRWAGATPAEFRFAVKFPRDLLDPKKPVDPEKVAAFVEHARLLGPKLGPIALQFAPWVRPGRAEAFLQALLAALPPGPRYAVELREAGWYAGPTFDRLRRDLTDRRIALVWSFLTYLDVPPELTTDFVYLRFIGDHTTVPADRHGEVRVDRSTTIDRWAQRLASSMAERGIDGFAYFNNHFAGFAPESVNTFRRALRLPAIEFRPPDRSSAKLEAWTDPTAR